MMKATNSLILLMLTAGALCCAQSAQPAQPANPAPPPAAQVSAAADAGGTYVIGPADVLTVTVWKEPTLSGELLVRPDGMISMPLVGDVKAAGVTPEQLANTINGELKKYIQNPNVSVVVSQIHSKTINVLGEVQKRGPEDLTSGMTLLDAIGAAGGLTDFANKKKIYILRNEGGKTQRIPVHYKEALKGDPSYDVVLKAGDTIVVP